jgi:hypothetical protein
MRENQKGELTSRYLPSALSANGKVLDFPCRPEPTPILTPLAAQDLSPLLVLLDRDLPVGQAPVEDRERVMGRSR